MTCWKPLGSGFWTSSSTCILNYLSLTMLVLVADSHWRTFGNSPTILMAFSFVMNLIGSSCIWTQKEDMLKSISARFRYGFHSLRSIWAPFIDQGRFLQTLFLSCSFLKEKRNTFFPSCSILICSSVNQTLLIITTTTFLLIDLSKQILPTSERFDSIWAPTLSTLALDLEFEIGFLPFQFPLTNPSETNLSTTLTKVVPEQEEDPTLQECWKG